MPEKTVYDLTKIANVIAKTADKVLLAPLRKPFTYPSFNQVTPELSIVKIPAGQHFCYGVKIFTTCPLSVTDENQNHIKFSEYASKEGMIGTIAHYKDDQFIYIVDNEGYREKIFSIVQKVSEITGIKFMEKPRSQIETPSCL